MHNKLLISFLGVIPIFSYAMICNDNGSYYGCNNNQARENVDLTGLNKGYIMLSATTNWGTFTLKDANINLQNYSPPLSNNIINITVGNINGNQI